MNEHVLHFNGTALEHCEAPEWYDAIMRDADDKGGDVVDIYRRNSVYLDHQFGHHGHSVMVYNAGAHGHIIEYYDAAALLAVVLIDNVASYLDFRAKYLFGWAWLIKEMDRIAVADYEQKQRKRA